MNCVACGSAAVTERPERTGQGYRRFRCRTCGKQYNERSGTLLNHAQYPSDVIALVVLWRLRYRLLAYSDETSHRFRSKPAACSEANQPGTPMMPAGVAVWFADGFLEL